MLVQGVQHKLQAQQHKLQGLQHKLQGLQQKICRDFWKKGNVRNGKDFAQVTHYEARLFLTLKKVGD